MSTFDILLVACRLMLLALVILSASVDLIPITFSRVKIIVGFLTIMQTYLRKDTSSFSILFRISILLFRVFLINIVYSVFFILLLIIYRISK